MRLNARLDAIHEAQLIKIQEQTQATVSEIVRSALENYYQTVCEHPSTAKDALFASGFVGCAEVVHTLLTMNEGSIYIFFHVR